MQLSLFFISLLATVSGLPVALHPKNLVANALDVDPNAIQSLKDYVDELVQEGKDEISALTQVKVDAEAALASATDALALAVSQLEDAQTIHDDKVTFEATMAADELRTKNIRAEKLGIKNAKKSTLDGATSFEASEQTRLDNEKSLFEKVKELLVGVRAADRRLLNAGALSQALALLKETLMQKSDSLGPALALLQFTSNSKSDPAQVDKALGLLDDLIAAGEQERADAVAALQLAQSEYNEASKVHAGAVEVHTLAEGALEDARICLSDAKDVLNVRKTEHTEAIEVKSDATDDLADKTENLEARTKKIESEEIDLDTIKTLLAKLD
jgi:hypothetical protein